MKKLFIAALFISSFAQAENTFKEVSYRKYLIQGKHTEGKITLVTTQNPEMALLVAGIDSKTLDRIAKGKLTCAQSDYRKKVMQELALSKNAYVAQVEQAIALGLKMDETQASGFSDVKDALKFVNAAGDALYYDCK